MIKKIILAAFFLISVSKITSQTTYILCGKLVNTKTGKIENKKTIVVEKNKIISVLNGYVQPRGGNAKTVDLKNKVVMPGLTDMHVHLESEHSPKARLNSFILNESDIAFNSTVFAKDMLMAGFTMVRDLGGSGVNVALRNAINQGKVIGPRVFTAEKSIATTGGHADPTNGGKSSLIGNPGPKDGVINSVADAKKAVRQRYKNGADCIKITATGGVLSVAKNGSNPQFTIEEVKAICKTAKDYGMHVAAHAHGDEGMRRAILGGVKTIEHGTYMSDSTMELMKKYNTYLVPTMTAGKEVVDKAKVKGYFPAIVVPKALAVGPQIAGTFSRAYKKGVPIVFGTDAGVFKHARAGQEFGLMVKAGMPPIEAIQAATITPAKILNKENEIGQIDTGFYADIIAVDEDLTKNINTMENVTFVMKNGVIYKK